MIITWSYIEKNLLPMIVVDSYLCLHIHEMMLQTNHVHISQVAGVVCNKKKMHHEGGYPGKVLHPSGDPKTPVSKSERHPFAQEDPEGP